MMTQERIRKNTPMNPQIVERRKREKESISPRLKAIEALIDKKGLKQGYVADKVGISQVTLSRGLKGTQPLLDYQLELLEDYLDHVNSDQWGLDYEMGQEEG